MRRDAELRRDALIEAAIQAFHERGYDVPLEEIARRAGVGRGTLYRNFKDRVALILAIFNRNIDQASAETAAMADVREVLTTLMARAAPLSPLYSRLAHDLPQDERTQAEFAKIRARTDAYLTPIIDRARRAGLMRAEIGLVELRMVLRMAGGLVLPAHTPAEARAVSEQVLALVMDGLRPRA